MLGCQLVFPILGFIGYILGFGNNPCDTGSYIIHKCLRIKIIQINNNERINSGVIITNHRSFTDFYLDPYLNKCPCITRGLAVIVIFLGGLLAIIYNRCIYINRDKDDRFTIYSKIKSKLFLYYPEGTRCSHLELPSNYKDIQLKYGLLKSIYENKRPLQINISKNKELVINEKQMKIQFGITIYNIVGDKILAEDYNTFEDYIDKIKLDWFNLWNKLYDEHL
jgi:1-acyl-sn-glycerol-3-phosphate acyltransferase